MSRITCCRFAQLNNQMSHGPEVVHTAQAGASIGPHLRRSLNPSCPSQILRSGSAPSSVARSKTPVSPPTPETAIIFASRNRRVRASIIMSRPFSSGHGNVGDDQIRRCVTVPLKSLATIGSLHRLIPAASRVKRRSARMHSSSSIIRMVAIAQRPCYWKPSRPD